MGRLNKEQLNQWGAFKNTRTLNITPNQSEMIISMYSQVFGGKRKKDTRGVMRMIEKLDKVFDTYE